MIFNLAVSRDIRESVEALVRPNQLFADAVDVRQVSTISKALSLAFLKSCIEALAVWQLAYAFVLLCVHNL